DSRGLYINNFNCAGQGVEKRTLTAQTRVLVGFLGVLFSHNVGGPYCGRTKSAAVHRDNMPSNWRPIRRSPRVQAAAGTIWLRHCRGHSGAKPDMAFAKCQLRAVLGDERIWGFFEGKLASLGWKKPSAHERITD